MTNETTAPERIWFNGGLIESHMHTSRREFAGGVEYVRADALEAAQARIAELEGALRDIATPKVGPDFDWSDREVSEWRAGRWKWAQKTARAALQEGKG